MWNRKCGFHPINSPAFCINPKQKMRESQHSKHLRKDWSQNIRRSRYRASSCLLGIFDGKAGGLSSVETGSVPAVPSNSGRSVISAGISGINVISVFFFRVCIMLVTSGHYVILVISPALEEHFVVDHMRRSQVWSQYGFRHIWD